MVIGLPPGPGFGAQLAIDGAAPLFGAGNKETPADTLEDAEPLDHALERARSVMGDSFAGAYWDPTRGELVLLTTAAELFEVEQITTDGRVHARVAGATFSERELSRAAQAAASAMTSGDTVGFYMKSTRANVVWIGLEPDRDSSTLRESIAIGLAREANVDRAVFRFGKYLGGAEDSPIRSGTSLLAGGALECSMGA